MRFDPLTIKSAADIGFSHAGTWITNPTVGIGGVFPVAPEHYGFQIVDMGFGFTAWRKDLPDEGTYLLLTDGQGKAGKFDAGDELLLCLYEAGADHAGAIACKTLRACEVAGRDDDERSRLI
jgi:hypothetical protein